MNYCKHLKKRKNKPYCNLLKQEIPFCRCRECGNKEYKINNKNFTIFVKNDTFCTKNAKNNKKNVRNLKNKSKKQAKKERERFSVFTTNDKCMVCKSTYQLTWNEIYRGRNRSNSMKYGFCLRMCLNCHREYQEDAVFNDHWHKTAQRYFEEHYGTRDEFIKIFRRNYLE